MSGISFKLETFEGPLDLLLHLISKHKLNIHDIEISLLLEQYMEYMNQLVDEDYDSAADFLEMAARLIYIKTCSLLPQPEDADELKKELEGRIIEYSLCKLAVVELKKRYVGGEIFIHDGIDLPINKIYSRTHEVSLLYDAYMGISSKIKKIKPIRANMFSPIVSHKIVSVTSKIIYVLKKLYKTGICEMSQLYIGMTDKSEKVATFLAVLELTRSGRITINEENTEIKFHKTNKNHKSEEEKQAQNSDNIESENDGDLIENEIGLISDEIDSSIYESALNQSQKTDSIVVEEVETLANNVNTGMIEDVNIQVSKKTDSTVVEEVKTPANNLNTGMIEDVNIQVSKKTDNTVVEEVKTLANNVDTGVIEDVNIQVSEKTDSIVVDEIVTPVNDADKPIVMSNQSEVSKKSNSMVVKFSSESLSTSKILSMKLDDMSQPAVAAVASININVGEVEENVSNNVKAQNYIEHNISSFQQIQEDISCLTEPPKTVIKPNYWQNARYRWGNSPVGDDKQGNFWRYGNQR